jgi:hypothetical protein
MTEHERYQADLKAYQDNELPLFLRLALRRHVAACPACREELMQMTQVTEEVRADEARIDGSTPSIDAPLKNRILDTYRPPTRQRESTSIRGISPRNLAAAATILVVAVVFVGKSEKRHYEPQVTKAQVARAVNDVRGISSESAPSAVPNGSSTQYYATTTNSTHEGPTATLYAPVDASGVPASKATGAVRNFTVGASAPVTLSTNAQTGTNPGGNNATLTWRPIENQANYNVYSSASLTRRVHKEATITVDVGDPEATSDDIEGKVKGAGGFVASNSLTTGDDGRKTASMTLKVPVAQFETILGQVAHLGDVKEKNVTGEDITEQVSDAGQKENVLEDEVNRADARLKQLGKKTKWDDAETARDLRIQLAQSRARLVLLKKLGELSEIDVTLTQKLKPTPPPASGFMTGMNDTTRSAVGSLLDAVSTLVTIVIWIAVYAPIWIPAGLFGRRLYRRYRAGVEPANA